MKNIFFLFTLICISCSTNFTSQQFEGNWNSKSSANEINFHFESDSVTIDQWGTTKKYLWRLIENKMYFSNESIKENFYVNFKLNRNNDTLFLKNEHEKEYQIFVKSNKE
ncbi:MAG: hypothetical protein KYX68_12160 [Flavobacterium sp.]|nr:hypothetical protein [Flavobacterium sp.]